MISKEEVLHIAKLARLDLTEQEVADMQRDLSSILDYFDLLKKAPKPKHAAEARQTNVLRADEAHSNDIADDLINASPLQKDGYIQVKQVL